MPARPKLVVILVVDQMRADYAERYGHQWTKGLRRLLDQGARFPLAAYPYFNTVTCPGHATIGTGAFPATHGMILNAWWDRALGRQLGCTEDLNAKPISYGAPFTRADSGAPLLVPTLADELRVQLGASTRVVSFSLKARSAIGMAGHRGDAVMWFEANPGAWITSSAFTAAPVPFVQQFVQTNPVESDFGKPWTRLLPDAAYLFADDEPGEKPAAYWTRAFPHPLRGSSDKPDTTFYNAWRKSPYSDAYLGRMAQAAVDSWKLGQGSGTDFLGVSFSALDLVGHDFGPRSHEVQDVLARLDATIGALLDHLDRAVGRENYVVALTADHGVAPIPEQAARDGLDAGRIVMDEIATRMDQALAPFLGEGRPAARVRYTDVYFAPGVYDKLRENPAAMRAAIDAALSVPGVLRVFRSEELAGRPATNDPLLRAASLSYHPARSGDLILVPKPYWFFVPASRSVPPGDATTHGTAHAYDARVPVILMGGGIQPGEYFSPASPADIAPTLAFLCGVTLSNADGRVLAEALAPRKPPTAAAPKKSAR